MEDGVEQLNALMELLTSAHQVWIMYKGQRCGLWMKGERFYAWNAFTICGDVMFGFYRHDTLIGTFAMSVTGDFHHVAATDDVTLEKAAGWIAHNIYRLIERGKLVIEGADAAEAVE